jgi:signal transduction histidine kinase
MKFTVIQRSTIGLSIALLLVLLFGVWLHHTIRSSLDSGHMVAHTWDVLLTLSNLGSKLNDAERESRDYIATGSSDDWQLIEANFTDALSLQSQMRALVIDNPRQEERLDKLDPLIQRFIKTARSMKSAPKLLQRDISGDLTAQNNVIRQLMRNMRDEERGLMDNRLESHETGTQETMFFALIGTLLTLVLIGGSGYLLIREVRERTKAERTLTDKTQLLAAANEELEAFTYSVSHDLRAPLRAMSGFAKILEEDFGPRLADGSRRYLGLIQKNAKRMGSLIDDLLAFSRLSRQTLTRSLVSPAGLVRETFDSLEADRKGRDVELLVDELPPCRADYNLLRQVFVNLLSNALKFTRTRANARIEVGSHGENGQTAYFVRDNGVGFDIRYVDKLFRVFQRLHRVEDYEGTGVGLAIVQRIVARHGGRIWAESILDHGATFYFTLSGDESSGR